MTQPARQKWGQSLTTIGNTWRGGFTGHEHLDSVGLIHMHMNGQVYDPVVARFLSRDPFIDGVDSSQGPNGYAYVHNNPLAKIDPTGFVGYCSADNPCQRSDEQFSAFLEELERQYVRHAPQNHPRDDSISLDDLPPQSFPSYSTPMQRPLAVFTGLLMDSAGGSTVGGSSVHAWADFINDAADFSAGWGDLVSFGLSARTRELWDIGSVDPNSGAYSRGEVFGFVNVALTGYGAGTRAAARASSATRWSNFSHSLFPHRWLRRFNNPVAKWLDKTGNRLNGDFVSAQLHTRMDTAAQFGLSAAWLRANPLFSPLRQWINRLPYMPGSIVYGTGSAAINCNDDCE